MCSDLTLSAIQILEVYCRRASIESMFSVLKNLIGGLAYHFWSTKIEKSSRRPKKNKDSNSNFQHSEELIKGKLRAIEMFVNMSAILVGILQIMALQFPKKIWKDNIHWLRTVSNKIPSEYIVNGVLTQAILINLHKVNAHATYALIRSRQSQPANSRRLKKVA